MADSIEPIKLDGLTIGQKAPSTAPNDEDDIVDPWNVASKSDTGINYEKLIG